MRLSVSFCALILTYSAFGQGLNDAVMSVANSMEGGGYKWASSGSPKDIYFNGEKILSKSAEGTFCSGYTFATAFDVLHQNGKLDHLTVDQARWLQRNWYGTNAQSAETQCLYTLQELGLGDKVDLTDALTGDFVQFWRNNGSGHSVIFLAWLFDDSGNISGLKYRSTQRSTNGIGDREEGIGNEASDINLDRVYIVRLSD